MISLILGTESKNFLQYLIERSNNSSHNRLYLIVPDQYSFYAEKQMLSISEMLKKNIEVFNFKQLTREIFKRFGGIAGNFATKATKVATMNLILQELKNELKTYGKLINRPTFAETLLKTAENFKSSDISNNFVETQLNQLKNDRLKEKTLEFLQIYHSYCAQLKATFKDPSDSLKKANEKCLENNFFCKSEIYFDKFISFSGSQLSLISTMINQADVHFSLCFEENEPLFETVNLTINKIKQIAKENKVEINKPVFLEPIKKSEEILEIEKKILRRNKTKDAEKRLKKSRDVEIYAADDEFDEICYVSCKIKDLIRKGFNYSDICILTRNLEDYKFNLTSCLENYSIPNHFDETLFANEMNLIKFCENILELSNKFDINICLDVLKSQLTKFEPEEIAIFENYIFVWNITKKTIFSEFKNNPKGLAKSELTSEEDLKNLETAKLIQKTILNVVNSIKNSKNNAKEISNGLLEAMEILEVENKNLNDELPEEEKKNFVKQWEVLINILETIYDATKNIEISKEQFEFLFKETAKSVDIGQIPQTLNSVLVGSTEKTILTNPKVTFIIGANDKIFPFQHFSLSELFSSEDLLEFEKIGVKFSKTLKEKNSLELLQAFKATISPNQKLFITYKTSDCFSGEFKKSRIIDEIIEIFGDDIVKTSSNVTLIDKCSTKKAAFKILAQNYYKSTEEVEALKEYFKQNERYSEFFKEDCSTNISDVSCDFMKLFKNTVSPSQVEQFYFCPFSYFCKYGLKINSMERVDLNAINKGTIFHKVLEKTVALKNFSELSLKNLKLEIEKQLENFLLKNLGGKSEKSEKFLINYFSLAEILQKTCETIQKELNMSDFKPIRFELPIKNNYEIESLTIKTSGNLNISVEGKMDRLDLIRKNNKNLIRLIDYKTNKKAINYSDILLGRNLQMLIYLDALLKSRANFLKNSSILAMIYVPIVGSSRTYCTQQKSNNKLEISGFFLNIPENIEILKRLSSENLTPIRFSKDGSIHKSDEKKMLLSVDELNLILKFVENKIKKMYHYLKEGEFEKVATNVKTENSTISCDFCCYNEICNRKQVKLADEPLSLTKYEFLELIEKEIKNDNQRRNF